MASKHYQVFSEDIVEVSYYDLVDGNGGRINPVWFGSIGKKDLVVVSTAFGILGRALRCNNPGEDKFLGCKEFQLARDALNSLNFMAGDSDLPAILVNTPATPEQIACPPGSDSPEIPGEIPTKHFQQSFEALEDLERTPYGPRLQMKCAGNVSKALLEDLRGHFTSKGLNIGKVFGYGYLYLRDDNEDFVREIVSTALLTVAQKQEIRKALSSLLTDKVHEKYVDFMRVWNIYI